MSEVLQVRGEHAPGALPEARSALAEWVREGGEAGRVFLQAHLLALPGGRFRIRHVDDRDAAAGALGPRTDPFAAREIAQTTASGAHRPLKTAPDLRSGWSLDELDERGLWIALDYLYPACAIHWFAEQGERLRLTSWADTAGRQSGMYSSVRLLPPEALPHVVRACCADAVCLRRVAWGRSEEEPAPLDPDAGSPTAAARRPAGDADIPCPEACSMFISFARVVLRVERSARRDIPGLGKLNDLELQQLRQLVAAAAEGTGESPREGEFDEPLNRRRLRYLAARLEAADDELPPA
jgi:DR2241 stabilising domain/4Fe-4S iron-sulfur cluster binding domain